MPASDRSVPAPRSATGFRRVIANLVHLASGKAAAGLISLVYLVIATRTLGAQGYGLLVLVNAYAVLVGGIVAFSGFHGVVRYGALALERGDRARFARVIRFLAIFELACGIVAVVVAALLVPWIGPRIGLSGAALDYAVPYALAVVATVRATPQGLLQIAGRFDLVGAHQIVSPIVRLAGALLAWALGAGVGGFVLAWLVAAIAEGVSMWALGLIAWRQLAQGEPLRGPWRGAMRTGDGLMRFVLTTNLDLTVRELATNLAPLTIGWMLGPAATGVFSLVQRATNVLAQPATLLGQASYPVLTGQAARREFEALARTTWQAMAVAGAAAAAIVAALALGGEGLLALLGGRSFAIAGGLLVLVAAARGFALMTAPVAAALTAIGRPDRSLSVGLAANLGLFPLLPVLLDRLGTIGAGWHALLQGAGMTLTLIVLFARDRASAARDG